MQKVIFLGILFLAQPAVADAFSLKGDTLGTSLNEWREKHRHVSEEYKGKQTFAPMCSDTSPKNPDIRPPKAGVGEVICELYYPYQQKKVTVANVEARIRYYFNTDVDGHGSGNGLRLILASFNSRSYGKIRAALIGKWGEPTQSSVKTLQNAYGATFEGAELVWADGNGQMRLAEYSVTVSKSSLILLNAALAEEASKRTASTPNPDVDDL